MYWRDKRGLEIDFVLPRRREGPIAIECKLSAAAFDPTGMAMFRRLHPKGRNFVVVERTTPSIEKRFGDLPVWFVSLPELIRQLMTASP